MREPASAAGVEWNGRGGAAMKARLFEDLVVSSPPTGLGRRAALLPLSVAAHAAALALALLVPVFRPGDLPAPVGRVVDWPVPVTPTPPPPVRPHDAPARAAAAPRPAPSPPSQPEEPAVAPPAPGPPISIDNPPGIPAPDAPTPCLANCDPAGVGSGDGPRDRPTGPGDTEGTGTHPIRAGGKIKPPTRVVYVPPAYPEIARAAGVSAMVVLECTIDPAGHVADVRVVTGHPLLNDAALTAVRQWRYTPTLLNDVPVPVLMTVTVRFVARR